MYLLYEVMNIDILLLISIQYNTVNICTYCRLSKHIKPLYEEKRFLVSHVNIYSLTIPA